MCVVMCLYMGLCVYLFMHLLAYVFVFICIRVTIISFATDDKGWVRILNLALFLVFNSHLNDSHLLSLSAIESEIESLHAK